MPLVRVTHYNPKTTYGKTACGRRLHTVKNFTDDINNTTCNVCLRREHKR